MNTSNAFYKHVSSWIDGYYNAESLEWLRRFVDNSDQPEDIKKALNKEIDLKVAYITGTPAFSVTNGKTYLVDKHGNADVITTHYAAMNKKAQLDKLGYITELESTGTFYKIVLNGKHTMTIDSVELKTPIRNEM